MLPPSPRPTRADRALHVTQDFQDIPMFCPDPVGRLLGHWSLSFFSSGWENCVPTHVVPLGLEKGHSWGRETLEMLEPCSYVCLRSYLPWEHWECLELMGITVLLSTPSWKLSPLFLLASLPNTSGIVYLMRVSFKEDKTLHCFQTASASLLSTFLSQVITKPENLLEMVMKGARGQNERYEEGNKLLFQCIVPPLWNLFLYSVLIL